MATEGTDGGGGTANVRDKYATDDEHPQAGARRRTPSSSHIRLAAPVLAHPDSGRVCPSRSHLTYSSRNVDGHITSHAVPIATRPAIPAVSPPTRPDTPLQLVAEAPKASSAAPGVGGTDWERCSEGMLSTQQRRAKGEGERVSFNGKAGGRMAFCELLV